MPGHDIIVMGASSGGIESLMAVAAGLPRDLPAAVFVVLHIPATSHSWLPQILSSAGALPAHHVADEEPIEPGHIYVAPPDHHLLLDRGYVHVLRGPKENNHRPAIDPLFRSAARAYGPRVVGVVLSGALDDGSAGLLAVKRQGGVAIVQDPKDALFPSMPENAMQIVDADFCLKKSDIAAVLARLAVEEVKVKMDRPVSEEIKKETEIEAMDMSTIENDNKPGTPSVFGCPDCGGVLWELQDGDLLRFRCRVGHAYGAEGLLSAQSEHLDAALWSAFRALQEKAALSRRLAARARDSRRQNLVEVFEKRARSAENQSRAIRKLLTQKKGNPEGETPES